jgi:hypothetical protein
MGDVSKLASAAPQNSMPSLPHAQRQPKSARSSRFISDLFLVTINQSRSSPSPLRAVRMAPRRQWNTVCLSHVAESVSFVAGRGSARPRTVRRNLSYACGLGRTWACFEGLACAASWPELLPPRTRRQYGSLPLWFHCLRFFYESPWIDCTCVFDGVVPWPVRAHRWPSVALVLSSGERVWGERWKKTWEP